MADSPSEINHHGFFHVYIVGSDVAFICCKTCIYIVHVITVNFVSQFPMHSRPPVDHTSYTTTRTATCFILN